MQEQLALLAVQAKDPRGLGSNHVLSAIESRIHKHSMLLRWCITNYLIAKEDVPGPTHTNFLVAYTSLSLEAQATTSGWNTPS